MSGFGSGLDAQFGLKEEAVVGTLETAVDHFYEFSESGITLTPNYLESDGIRAGSKFKRVSQTGIATVTAAGDVTVPYTYKGMGQLWRLALGAPLIQGSDPGATPVLVSGATSTYEQILVPGGMRGLSASVQIGKPEPGTGTIKPFNYRGMKVTDWELDVATGAKTVFKLTFDGWDEDITTPLTTATYLADNGQWDFGDVDSFTFGGTASTTSHLTAIAGGTPVSAVVTSLTLAGTNSLATDRYGLGNAGIKAEQLENNFCVVTGSFEAELAVSELYQPFSEGTTGTIEVKMEGSQIEAGYNYMTDFIFPAVKFTEGAASISGPDLVKVSGKFTTYDDEVNPVIQVHIYTDETTL